MKGNENIVQRDDLRSLSTEGLAMLGADQLAYIRSHQVKVHTIYMVHGANGRELAGFDNFSPAMAACYGHDLEAVALQ